MTNKIGIPMRPLRVAIIGAGPAGFYAAEALLKAQKKQGLVILIDLFDRLPTPYGLVRAGVAPDHPKIKKVIKGYHKTAANPNVRFFGNVNFGTELTHDAVRRYYDQVIYAFGTPSDRKLGIPGEELEGSHPATIFVGWYNAHPDYVKLDFNLKQVKNVAVIGNGNVSMDVSRILAKPATSLVETDIADYALATLQESAVEKIYIIGRRGPGQSKFTNPELREFGQINEVNVIVNPQELILDAHSQAEVDESKGKTRNMKTLHQFANTEATSRAREVHFRFFRSPTEILGEEGKVTGIRLCENKLVHTESGYMKSVSTGVCEELDVDLVLRAVGYKGIKHPGIPFEPRKGIVPNEKGRVIDPESGAVISGEYVVGWVKRGPSGVIGTNRKDAMETVNNMLQDIDLITPVADDDADPQAALDYIKSQQPKFVSFEKWLILDKLEVERGHAEGRSRLKFADVQEMLDSIDEVEARS